MMVLKKRQMTIGALIVLICIAGYLNWTYKTNPLGTQGNEATSEVSNDVTASKSLGQAQLVNSQAVEDTNTAASGGANNVSTNSSNYFSEAKINKDKARSESVDLIKSILNSSTSDPKAKEKAQQDITKIANNIDKENTIESLLKAKGFNNSVIFINDDSVNVIVGTNSLLPSDTAKIQDIVTSQTNISTDKIKIMQIKN